VGMGKISVPVQLSSSGMDLVLMCH